MTTATTRRGAFTVGTGATVAVDVAAAGGGPPAARGPQLLSSARPNNRGHAEGRCLHGSGMAYQTPTFFGRLRLVFIALAAIVGLMILAEATLTRTMTPRRACPLRTSTARRRRSSSSTWALSSTTWRVGLAHPTLTEQRVSRVPCSRAHPRILPLRLPPLPAFLLNPPTPSTRRTSQRASGSWRGFSRCSRCRASSRGTRS
jgi:hypothetical protein